MRVVGASWLMVTTTSCLQLNPDFTLGPEHTTLREDASDASPDTSSTQFQEEPTGPTSEGQSPDTSTPTGPLTQPNESPSEESTSSLTRVSSSSYSTSSSQPSNSSLLSSDSTNSSSSSSTSTTSWLPIEINASQAPRNVPAGYAFSVLVNHAQLVSHGAAANGSDLAIVSKRGATETSLHRVLDPDSSWNTTSTRLWFALDRSINQGSIVDDEYFIVVNAPGLPAQSNADQVFLNYDAFDTPTLDTNRWTTQGSSSGSRGVTKISDGFRVHAAPSASYPLVYFRVRHSAKTYPQGIRVDARTRFPNAGRSGNCGRLFPLSFRSDGDDRLRTGLRSDLTNYATLSYSEMQGINEVETINSTTPRNDTWEVHSMVWEGQDISYWRNATRLAQTQSQGTTRRPDQTPLMLEISAGAWTNGCSDTGSLRVDIDWVRVREYMSPAPFAQLK